MSSEKYRWIPERALYEQVLFINVLPLEEDSVIPSLLYKHVLLAIEFSIEFLIFIPAQWLFEQSLLDIVLLLELSNLIPSYPWK